MATKKVVFENIVFSFELPETLKRDFEAICTNECRRMSEVLRDLMRQYITEAKEDGIKKEKPW